MTSLEKVVDFAKKNCTVINDTAPNSADEWGNWNGYKVFVPDYDFRENGEELPETGLPEFILVKDNIIRLADAGEIHKIMTDGECTIPSED